MRIIKLMDFFSLVRAILFLLFIYYIIFPVFSAYRFTHPLRFRVDFVPAAIGQTSYETIKLTSKDGTVLAGWYVPPTNGAAVIMLHGLGINRIMMVAYARSLLQAGYGVLMYDLRAHGNSEGRLFARSQEGVDDVLTAVAFLTKRKEVTAAGIGIVGISIGGLFALQAAARTVAIRSVFVEGASPAVFADLPKAETIWQQLSLLLEWLYLKATDIFTRKPHLPANLTVIPKLSPRAVLFVSTGRGSERRLIQNYVAAAGDPKTWWEIPEARHSEGRLARPEAYDQKLLSFFDGTLLPNKESRNEVGEID